MILAMVIDTQQADSLHPADAAHLAEYASGAITARETARRVLVRLGIEVPSALEGEWVRPEDDADYADLRPDSPLSDDTQAFARGDLDVDGWLTRAQQRYATG